MCSTLIRIFVVSWGWKLLVFCKLRREWTILRVILELIRILATLFFFGILMGATVSFIYASLGINVDDTPGAWLVGFSILILIFVLYRNKLQFSGFYNGGGMVKLSKKVSNSLVACSVIMLILAPFIR